MHAVKPVVHGMKFVEGVAVDSLPENIILCTRNYGQFKLDPANRPIIAKKLGKMTDVIRVKNLLHLFPIVVSRDLTIIDGQHRLKVAEALNTPIYYIISDQMHIEDAAVINTVTTKWTHTEWLHYWCVMGKPDYLILRDFANKHDWLSLSMARELVGGAAFTATTFGGFERGEFRVKSLGVAEKVANMAKDFSKWVSFWSHRPFVRALMVVAQTPGYSHKRMMEKVAYQSKRMVRCVNVEDYIALLNDVYNYRTTEAHRLEFVPSKFGKRTRKTVEPYASRKETPPDLSDEWDVQS